MVEDNEIDIDLFEEYIFDVIPDLIIRSTGKIKNAISILENENFDIIILDLNLPDSNGIATFNKIIEVNDKIPIIVLSGTDDTKLALQTITLGAQDYLFKNKLNSYLLFKSISYSIERHKNQRLMRINEKKIREKQKMEAIGRFAGGIAHDFNNLMSIILGYANAVIMDTNQTSESLYYPLSEIINSGNRAVDLVKQLLIFSSNNVLKEEVVDVSKLITNLIPILNKLTEGDIEILTEITGNEYLVKMNRSQLEQIVLNLVVNSYDAIIEAERFGTITIRLSEKKITPENQDMIVLEVEDNGIGMSEETQKKIFEPFYTTKDVGKGTGLGLTTIYGIVDSKQGKIYVESEKNIKTKFTIMLHKTTGSAKTELNANYSELIQSYSGLNEGKSILVIEDNQSVRIMLSNILNKLGYQLTTLSNGIEAKNYLISNEDKNFDLILCDIFMPRMNGFEFYNWIRTNLSHNLPIILTSGSVNRIKNEKLKIDQVINDPYGYLIEKPLNPTVIQNVIIEMLKRSKSDSS